MSGGLRAHSADTTLLAWHRVNHHHVNAEIAVLVAGLGGSALAVMGSLGGVWLKGRYDLRRDEDQAARSERTARAQRRLDAYADLLVAAGEVLGAYRRLPDTLPPDYDERSAREANQRLARLAAELHRASAVVALTGSDEGREQGKALYLAARGLAATRVQRSSGADRALGGWDLITAGNDIGLETAIDLYKEALLQETAGLPSHSPG